MTLVSHKAWRIEKEYGSLNYKDKVVLDIGADYGCTPEFFLSRGAKRVIAVEADPFYYNRLVEWAETINKTETIVACINGMTAGNLQGLLNPAATDFIPQIVKIDCEGCECEFFRLNDDVLKIPEAYILETHSVAMFEAWTHLLRRLRYAVTVIEEFPKNPVERHRKVLSGVKRPPPRVIRHRRGS